MTQDLAIQTEGLTKYYGKTKGVEDLDLTVRVGEIYGFLGPNGAGKTTTIRLLLDLIRPTRGKAWIFGLDCQRDSVKIRERIGYVPGDVSLYKDMTGARLLRYFGELQHMQSNEFTEELVRRFGLDLSKKIADYSKGMRQMLALIQAFMSDPKLVVLDEPTSGLDPLLQQEFYVLAEEEKKRGRTIFMCTHLLGEAQRVCDRVGIIRNGRLVVVEEVEALRRKAGKVMDVVFHEDIKKSDLESPGIESISGEGRHYRLALGDNIGAAVKCVSRFKIQDITIQDQTLEDVFLRYYTKETTA